MTNICTAINLSVVLELLFYTGYFPEQRLRRRGMQVNQELESGEKKEEEPGVEEEQLQLESGEKNEEEPEEEEEQLQPEHEDEEELGEPEHEDEEELGEEKKQLQPDRGQPQPQGDSELKE